MTKQSEIRKWRFLADNAAMQIVRLQQQEHVDVSRIVKLEEDVTRYNYHIIKLETEDGH